jgi:hypothetical protein
MAKSPPKEKNVPAAKAAAAVPVAADQAARPPVDTSTNDGAAAGDLTPAVNERPIAFNVRAVGVARRCRAGRCFTEEGQSVDFSTLTEVQIRAIASDPHLKIDEPRLTPVDENIDAEDDATQTEAK